MTLGPPSTQPEPQSESRPSSPAGIRPELEPAPALHPATNVTEVRRHLSTQLADGEWHRLHPATPVLRGGIALVAILGYVISQLRERFFNLFVGQSYPQSGDPVEFIVNHGYVGFALLAVTVGLLVVIGIFWLSWRVHSFRITNEVVEVRSGILFRTNRRARLDRIQGINIVRPFFARLFGAARLEITVAGQGANVRLDYLSSPKADALRRDILRLASGTKKDESHERVADRRGFVDQRVGELLGPELDPRLAPPESVVHMNNGRLLGSVILHDSTLIFLLVLIGSAVAVIATGEPYIVFGLIPVFFGLGSFVFRRFTKSLRYTIAGTPDGVRVGFGLLSLSNETLPPGRIHSIQVRQPVLWRMAGWWEIRVNRASKSSTKGADGQQNTTILPVGNVDEVLRVLNLILPGLVTSESEALLREGMLSRGGTDGYTNSPRRAAVLRWFSWRRNGFASLPGVVLFRAGAIWRRLTFVPEPRVQSVGIRQGPLERALGVASLQLHTVTGPISAELGAVDKDAALAFFLRVSREVTDSAIADTTHRWRSAEDAVG